MAFTTVKALYEFQVSGRFEFPFDMLRYDTCWPKVEAETPLMSPHPRGNLAKENRTITLVGLKPPTAGRWGSFGWKVLEDSVKKRVGY
jgi:hypothetical protein